MWGRQLLCKFLWKSVQLGLLPKWVKYSAFVSFLTVLSCPVLFSILRPGRTVGPIFTLYGSNDMFPRKEVPFGVTTIDDAICEENMSPKPLKVGVNRQFQGKMLKYEDCSISKTVNPIKPKFEDKAETATCTSWVGYHCPKPNPTWLTAAILKIAMTS